METMISVNSISGGKTSAFIAANYPADFNLFSLVRIEDERCRFPDEKIRQEVEDRIQKPFIATAEENAIIYTMLDLEQFIGKPVQWVSGLTFEEVARNKGGWLPNKLHRYCTTEMKIIPMLEWWHKTIKEPVEMRIGFRANEMRRAKKMNERLNDEGLLETKATFSKHKSGRNKWEIFAWQKPVYPLIESNIYKSEIEEFWKDKPVRFAYMNNCVGCFHRNPMLLKFMFDLHPKKMQWFADLEKEKLAKIPQKGKRLQGGWKTDLNITYEQIKNYNSQLNLDFDDFTECDGGYCGL